MSFNIFHFFFFNDTATTEIYTLSLHDALPIWQHQRRHIVDQGWHRHPDAVRLEHLLWRNRAASGCRRSEEHTSELQSLTNLVCRLLLEKKKKKNINSRQHDENNMSQTMNQTTE